ncbi:MAG: isopentenyl-diphosphate Delta-isomerase [candidate division KSB1 bacterium]|nr:isopentenyl-diphosphate Delta-isomerase [candidate division KSB1 bacterium]MDZ7304020.1 isopentenyl-diphosphate Delta-isomerase [candidate division KSB1 bacterium]MDZ7313270.1 isopentenyl-diphosphate Delta-isomerase [candidate division KSB1 bacterium]
MSELVILVDQHDRQIGIEEKLKAHREGKLHRAFSVFIFNDRGEMLIQRRALHKYHSPGLWTNACCSHPRPGESIEHAANRRLREEMGLTCKLQKVFHFIYRVEFDNGLIEHEFDYVFIGKYEGTGPDELIPDSEEVADYRWLDVETLRREVKAFPEKYTVWFKMALEQVLQIAALKNFYRQTQPS